MQINIDKYNEYIIVNNLKLQLQYIYNYNIQYIVYNLSILKICYNILSPYIFLILFRFYIFAISNEPFTLKFFIL